MIQTAKRPIIQQPQNIIQPKTASEISVPENSQLYDKFIPIPNYIIFKQGLEIIQLLEQ